MNKIILARFRSVLVCLIFSISVANSQQFPVELSFENIYGNESLEFKKEYINQHQEKISFSLLNYFVSNIEFIRTDGSVYVIPQDSCYFLVRHNQPETKVIRLTIPQGKYKAVSLVIGIDSARSTQGADRRQGVLDVGAQARGMYWQWNSGYIFFKMEGKSPASPDSLKNSFYYHIGGYGGFDSKTLNNIRVKNLTFQQPLRVFAKKLATVTIAVDVKKFFEGNLSLKVGEHPSIMWGPLSTQIADNYVGIFSLKNASYSKATK
jgi:hypothetical protein